jgi:hypothetical protein
MTAKTIAIAAVAVYSVLASMAPASAFYIDKANMVQGTYVRSGENMETIKVQKVGCFVTYTPVEAERGIRHYREDC